MGRRIGNVHLRGETTELEVVKVTPAFRDLMRRRTDWIVRDYVSFDRPLRHALFHAYIAGINDAAESMEYKGKRNDTERKDPLAYCC